MLPGTILVGVDGSPGAEAAVRWAATRAASRRSPVRLVHVSTPTDVVAGVPATAAVPMTSVAGSLVHAQARDRAERTLLDEAAELVRRVDPTVDVSTERLMGGVAAMLVDASAEAALVVVGSRELGGVSAVLLGSVGIQVSGKAHCPTVVVHGTPPEAGPVVVGVDGSEASRAAAAFAIAEAEHRGDALLVAHSWAQPLPTGAGEAAAASGLADARAEEEGRQMVADVLGPLRRDFPTVDVGVRMSAEPPADLMLSLTDSAVLAVVGSRGHGSLAGLVLGSTSQTVLRRAPCPVAVLRPS